MQSCKQRLVWLDAMKAWGIFLVVAGHAFGAACHTSQGLTQQIVGLVYKYIYAFHMPLFFYVAGVTFDVKKGFTSFVRSRTIRLVVPYFVFGFLSLAIYVCVDKAIETILLSSSTTGFYGGKVKLDYWQQVLNLMLGGWFRGGFIINSVLWFLPTMFTLQLVAYTPVRYGSKTFLWFVILLMVPMAWVWHQYVHFRIPWGFAQALYYLPFFITGRLVGQKIKMPDKMEDKHQKVVALMLLIISSSLVVYNPLQYKSFFFAYLLRYSLAFFCIIAWQIFFDLFIQKHSLVTLISSATLGIMLMHKFPLLFFQNYLKLTRSFFQGSLLKVVLACLAVSLIALGLSLMAALLIRRTCPILLGEERRK